MTFMIYDESNNIMRLGWYEEDGTLSEVSSWTTREEAEAALSILQKHTIVLDGEPLNAVGKQSLSKLQIVEVMDS